MRGSEVKKRMERQIEIETEAEREVQVSKV